MLGDSVPTKTLSTLWPRPTQRNTVTTHTAEHVNACLKHLDICEAQVNKQHEVELALWFHDAVYNPLSGKNERKSADWATFFLSENSAESEAIGRVHRLVMVTQHNAPTVTKDESILVDIDLSILGADAATYEIFEQAVRTEYKAVPTFIYRKKRAAVLADFFARPRIYQNEPFTSEREHQAKVNLSNAISNLAGRA